MMQAKRQKILEYISTHERFSPSSLSIRFAVELKTAVLLCEEFASTHEDVQKWFTIICPTCESIVTGISSDKIASLKSAACEHCGTSFDIQEQNLFAFYKKIKKKEPTSASIKNNIDAQVYHQSETSDNMQPTPFGILNSLNKQPDRKFFENVASYVWHISDLHMNVEFNPFGAGHCNILRKKFLDILKKRGVCLQNDILIVSGDCTDNGSVANTEEFQKFLGELKNCGFKEENILFIPGNHDAWTGSSRPLLAAKSYLNPLRSESRLLQTFQTYPKRKLPVCFEQFENSPVSIVSRQMNGCDVEFILINSSIPQEMAKGVFPVVIPSFLQSDSVRIGVMHHHLIDDISRTSLDSDHFTKIQAMRVLNSFKAFDFIFSNDISISLHGHKHLQYYKQEGQVDVPSKSVHLIAAPSLMESDYDKNNGQIKNMNLIGFNVLIPAKKNFEFYFYRLEKWEYVLVHHGKPAY
ncbi:MAG: metallophosphoesterase [Deltaproteobacteria bacterium]|jgi:predicted MPP superfamily phosphohydrolase|nr:metallophosphoesterase [Deltaproteobacteria bacterium]